MLEARSRAGMVDDIVRHESGEPFYVRGEGDMLIPNPALNAPHNGGLEEGFARAATVFTATPQYPKGREIPSPYLRCRGHTLVPNPAIQPSSVPADPEWVQYTLQIE